VRIVPRLCEFYPGIWITTEGKARKNLSQGKKILSQGTLHILPKRPRISKPTHYKTHTHTHTHTHTTQPRITKQYKTTTVQIETTTVQDIPK